MISLSPETIGATDCADVACEQCAAAQWYAVYCEMLKERFAAVNLHHQLGLTVYLPMVKQQVRGQPQPTSLFPRYLFVQADFQTVAPSSINATPGVTRLVAFDQTPLPVPATVITSLHRQIEQLNRQGGLPPHPFQPGDAVRIDAGPLQGLAGVFIGPMHPSERVRILLNFLGRLNEVSVEAKHVTRPSPTPPLKRERRTRGRGRRVSGNE